MPTKGERKSDSTDDYNDDENDAYSDDSDFDVPSPSPSPSFLKNEGAKFSSLSLQDKGYSNKGEKKQVNEPYTQIPYTSLEVHSQIGGGGVGVIYSGYYKKKPVAIKKIFDNSNFSTVNEFMNELNILTRLNQPNNKNGNIVELVGACTTPPNLCIVLEIAHGSLHDLLHTDTNLNVYAGFTTRNKIGMCLDVASGLEFVHSFKCPGIIHRDIKAANVLVTYSHDDGDSEPKMILKLCDFGLSLTQNNTSGTPAYMAGELLVGKPFSRSVDTYAFGVVIWEIFSMEVPWLGYDFDDIKRMVTRGERLDLPSGVPAVVKEIIVKCWDARKDQRGEMKDWGAVLKQFLESYSEEDEENERRVYVELECDALDSFL